MWGLTARLYVRVDILLTCGKHWIMLCHVYHRHLFHSKNICPHLCKEEEGAYIFWMKQVPEMCTPRCNQNSNVTVLKRYYPGGGEYINQLKERNMTKCYLFDWIKFYVHCPWKKKSAKYNDWCLFLHICCSPGYMWGLTARLYVRVDILLTCGKHLNDHII
jgi:hypothetical protein